MKKIIALALTAAMAISMVACSSAPASSEETTETATYKVGMGVVVGATETAADAEAETDGQSQINTTVALVVFDSEDKVVSAEIDVAQQTTKWDATGAVTTSAADELRTKTEKGDDYNMAKYSDAIAEWYAQVDAFEAWMVGKTYDEVAGMALGENSHGYTDTPADEDLKAGCTISMSAFLEAIKEAHETAVEVEGLATAGLGSDVTATVSGAEDEETEGSAQVNSSWAAVALDEAGNIVWAKIDTAQQSTKWDVTGAVTANADLRTKYDKGYDYNMAKFEPNAVGEWFEQIDALTAWMTGKTVDAVVNMELGTNIHDYTDTPADEDLKAGCTISMSSFLAAIAQAGELQK
ncbi:MAG: hypothetical protein E7484_02375 [Ruminococcaceae bacterium]|nr:hypothetical protein [Oscillospiraceae bacterium]